MAPGMGIKAPVPRTRTGCLTCRKRKVKCDEAKPVCSRCQRLQRECTWSDDMQVVPHTQHPDFTSTRTINDSSNHPALHLTRPCGQSFVIEFPDIDRATVPYIHHFASFCSRFMAYANDSEGNPFQEELAPLAISSPALLHSMAALAAAHLSRTQKHHELIATSYYSMALRELNAGLSNPVIARSDSTLGACLLLCVYEITRSESSTWHDHLQGARDLILYRGGPKKDEYLTRYFSLLDVSGSLVSGTGTLIQGPYWLEDDQKLDTDGPKKVNKWPYYDNTNSVVDQFHHLMVYMAKLSALSAEAMGGSDPAIIAEKAAQIHEDIWKWWGQSPPPLRDQSNDWRRLPRLHKLSVAETLEEEAYSSTKSVFAGCIIYLNHILDPCGHEPQKPEVIKAISEVLEIAKETPEGYGLEMGLYWGLFMAGVAVFNDPIAEDLIRRKLKADVSVSIYHADRVLELLEVLWKRQHQYNAKYDWRQVQIQMGIQVHHPDIDNSRSLMRIPTSQLYPIIDMVSPKGTILLLGGTGKVSRRITPLLSTAGYPTLVASRSGTSPPLPSVSGVKFDWDDSTTYHNVFSTRNISAIFLIGPPNLDMLPPMKIFIDLALSKGVKRLVLLSASLMEMGDGPAMAEVSEYVSGLGVEWAVLRPSWFMENFTEQHHAPTIRSQSTIITATGNGKVPFISAWDIAAVAFHALTDTVPHNTDHLILGPELFSYAEVAALMSEKLGRVIRHVDISEQELVQDMQAFMPLDYARMLAELDTAIKEGKEERVNDVVKCVTGREPKTLGEFVDEGVRDGVWVMKGESLKNEGDGGRG
ncbi:Agroclavine dehydrogenase [Lachnellula willkommii]|uniref:Agroclavine dehydrogenase n=1 Tax=Lachnellula willkommii TaxID=215461 RepID=A0A559MFF8_9HELO|nr:Agroclavine dehydrogenase [Lachnellula willkommii]